MKIRMQKLLLPLHFPVNSSIIIECLLLLLIIHLSFSTALSLCLIFCMFQPCFGVNRSEYHVTPLLSQNFHLIVGASFFAMKIDKQTPK